MHHVEKGHNALNHYAALKGLQPTSIVAFLQMRALPEFYCTKCAANLTRTLQHANYKVSLCALKGDLLTPVGRKTRGAASSYMYVCPINHIL